MPRPPAVRAAGVALLTLAALATLVSSAAAGTISVDCAHTDLQQKINAASAGDTLVIKGTCVGNFVINKTLTLSGNPSATLDGNHLGRTMTITGHRTVHLIKLEITGGHESDGQHAMGGGIYSDGGVLTLSRVRLHGNVAIASATTNFNADAFGGGILFLDGVLRVTDSSITDNWAIASAAFYTNSAGGGIDSPGTVSILRSNVSANHALAESSERGAEARGGAISSGGGNASSAGPVTVASSHIDGNEATARGTSDLSFAEGGGLDLDLSAINANPPIPLTVTHSSISRNSATASAGGTVIAGGGGVLALWTKGTISDSQLLGNRLTAFSSTGSARVDGGALLIALGQTIALMRSKVTGSAISADGATTAVGRGGGIGADDPISLVSSAVSSNTVRVHSGNDDGDAEGGGVIAKSARLTVRNSTVDANRLFATSTATGGGISASDGLTMSGSTVSRNVASAGADGRAGGLALGGSVTDSIVNSTIASNQAAGFNSNAGGIETDANALTVTNTTVARNAAGSGGGLSVTGGTTTLEATIVAKNSATHSPDCKGTISSAGHNLIGKTLGCAGFGATASDKRNVDAKLGLLAANGGPTRTLALLNGSPALNAILPAQCAVTADQRGVKRPQGPRCDIGSFERAP
jgi:fibronectin-binding autotransporter adhesin